MNLIKKQTIKPIRQSKRMAKHEYQKFAEEKKNSHVKATTATIKLNKTN